MSTENTITTAAADVAAAPNATLDELVGTTTNTAILPEPDAHAYDEIATGDADPLILAATSSPAASSSVPVVTT